MLDLYKNIKKYRLERQLTQAQLAELVGYSDKGMIARIENGKVDLPQSQIAKFASALGVSPSDLMWWDGNSPLILSESDYQKFAKIITSLAEIPIPNLRPELSNDEQIIIERYRQSDEQTKVIIKRILTYPNNDSEEADNGEKI
jgi:transcriptional regulator with XRE-family HTH domain